MREATGHKTRKKCSGTQPDTIRHHRVRDDHRVPEGTTGGMIIACRRARRPARRGGWSSRAVSLGAGSRAVKSVAGSCLVTSRPMSATSCLCRVPGGASGTPVVCHAPAQQPPVADAASGGLRTYFLLSGRGVLSWCVRRRG